MKERLQQLDPIGTAVFLPCVICLLLALQWGGTTYPWKDGRVIAPLVLCAVLFPAFLAVQSWKQDSATVPPRIIKRRAVSAGMWLAFSNGAAMMIFVYYSKSSLSVVQTHVRHCEIELSGSTGNYGRAPHPYIPNSCMIMLMLMLML